MRTEEELLERMKDYVGANYIYNENGYIAWQISTGENYEIIFIETKESRKGYGTELFRQFVNYVKPPYFSVFVIRLAANKKAGHFYRKLGFKETRIPKLYKGDDAVIGVIPWTKLVNKLNDHEKGH